MVWRIKDRSDGVPIKWLSSDDHLHLSCCAANSHWGAVGTSDGAFLTYSAYRIAGNFHGAKYSRLNTGPRIFYPQMKKRPCLPLPAVVPAATTN